MAETRRDICPSCGKRAMPPLRPCSQATARACQNCRFVEEFAVGKDTAGRTHGGEIRFGSERKMKWIYFWILAGVLAWFGRDGIR